MVKHTPVLLKEAVDALNIKAGGRYVDCTFGFGGHSIEILKRGGNVLALDVEDVGYRALLEKLDETLLGLATNSSRIVRSQKLDEEVRGWKFENLIFRRVNFSKLGEVLKEVGWEKVDGILYDLGTSSWELAGSGRGFTYLKDEPLDMRLDQSYTVTAADLVNGLTEKELYDIFKNFGEESGAWRFARFISGARRLKPIRTTGDLTKILGTNNPDVLARVFQALRIAVNSELENLQLSLEQALAHLNTGGRLVVISFHSLEDRIVKNLSKSEMITPSEEEIRINPRSRSAKMRVLVHTN